MTGCPELAQPAGIRCFRGTTRGMRILSRPVDPLSQRILQRIGLDKPLHPDFGTVYQGGPSGIPYVVVPGTQLKVPVKFEYAAESDPGPYPIPRDAPIEGGEQGDRHVLVISAIMAGSTSYSRRGVPREGKAGGGLGSDFDSARTACGPRAGHRPMRPDCRSFRGLVATTRWLAWGPSATPSGSP